MKDAPSCLWGLCCEAEVCARLETWRRAGWRLAHVLTEWEAKAVAEDTGNSGNVEAIQARKGKGAW